MAQLAGIREIGFSSGKAKGMGGFEVYNAAGLRFTAVSDKCLDICELSYRGVNFSFLSKNGLTGPAQFNALDSEFLYYWSAGLLATCGLANTGPACTDEGLYRTMHGRIGMTPAENVCAAAGWSGDDYIMTLSGEMRESALFGMNLRLKRSISATLYGREVRIKDTLVNLEPGEEPYLILYHINFGYPLLDKGSRVVKPEGAVAPRNRDAEKGLGEWDTMTAPLDNEPEQVFFHENPADAEGYAYAGVVNPSLELGAYIKYKKEPLPVLAQWKSMRSHDYALGLEPGNTYIRGRKGEREAGALKTIPGYGEEQFELCIGVLDGKSEIAEFERKMAALRA